MKLSPVYLFVLFLSLAAGPAEEPGSVSLGDLDALTGRWIELRGQLAEESRLWENRKTRWEEEIRLLREESEILKQELAAGRDFRTSYEEERTQQLARAEQAASELRRLEEVLEKTVRELTRLFPIIPESLGQSLPLDAAELTAEKSGENARVRRSQELLAVLSGLEAMQNRFHVERERIETGGQRRQVDVLYLGLARAWAVSPDGTWAGIGRPGETGWEWTAGGVDPLQVQKALQVHNRQITAELVPLPLHISGEDQP